MTEQKILTARAWGYITRSRNINCETTGVEGQHGNNAEVVIVHGATESDILAGLSLLAKSREVCEWTKHHWVVTNCKGIDFHSLFTFRPSCGRRVAISERMG